MYILVLKKSFYIADTKMDTLSDSLHGTIGGTVGTCVIVIGVAIAVFILRYKFKNIYWKFYNVDLLFNGAIYLHLYIRLIAT